MKKSRKILLLLLGVLAIFGFSIVYGKLLNQALKNNDKPQKSTVRVVEENKAENNNLKLYKLAASSTSAEVEFSQTPKMLREWGIGEDEIVINGAYFLKNYLPAGYLVVNGKRVGQGMFDQDKSGLIAINDGKIRIVDLVENPIKPESKFDFALQSYPFLIKNSLAAISTDSGKIARRTAVGIDKENNIYILAVLNGEVSLYDFMQKILETKISFVHVLNLDGGPSTGIYAKWNKEDFFADNFTGVSSIIRFKKVK